MPSSYVGTLGLRRSRDERTLWARYAPEVRCGLLPIATGLMIASSVLVACGTEPREDAFSDDRAGGRDLDAPDSSALDARARDDAGDSTADAGVSPDAGRDEDVGVDPTRQVWVTRVIDGDTFVLGAHADVRSPDGEALSGQRVRLVGVDAPEIAHPPADDTSDCWGPEASEYTRLRVEGRVIQLRYDGLEGLRDPYGRILAYVLDDDGVLNEDLLALGYARAYRGARYDESRRYLMLERAARDAGLGLWACP
ncbi:MAG: thermonuclease family protein [Deltaproteobacteria bacterium]|nr:thermonuclease family protein [Deltaproteobacteria bacterium]